MLIDSYAYKSLEFCSNISVNVHVNVNAPDFVHGHEHVHVYGTCYLKFQISLASFLGQIVCKIRIYPTLRYRKQNHSQVNVFTVIGRK